jgi:integrase
MDRESKAGRVMGKKRRAGGDGSIYQDKDGRWRASIDLGYINGRRRRKQLSGKTRAEVVTKMRVARKEQESGRDLALASQTVGGYLARWLNTVVEPNRKESTAASYRQLNRLYIEPKLGTLRLDKLTGEHVQAMLNALRAEDLSGRTVRYVRSTLYTALEQAIKWGYVARNAAAAAEVPQGGSPKMKPLTEEQARQLLAAVKGHRLEALYRVALSFGLRRGEVLGLLWDDLDLDKGVLHITGQVLTIAGGKTIRVPYAKTEGSLRELPLPDVLIKALRLHKEIQDKERSTIGVDWQEHGLVFPSNIGTPMLPRNLVRHFKLLLKAADLPVTTRFHDLRHSCATILLAQGVPLKTVSDILGYSSIRVTADIYGHTGDDQKREAVDKIAGLFEEEEKENEAGEDEDKEAEEGG